MSPLGVEWGTKYTLVGPDGTIAVFNDSTSPNFVGLLNPESSGLDSPEVREDAQDATEADGGVHGNFYFGRRPVVLQGTIIASSAAQRNERVAKLLRASNAMRRDAKLSWKPLGATEEVFLYLRRQQPVRITKGYVKDFFVPLVAANPFPQGALENEKEAGAVGSLAAPFNTTATTPTGIAISPDGKHMYVSQDSASNVAQFSISEVNGALAPLSTTTIAAGPRPFDVVISPDGKHVYVANFSGNTIQQYSRNESTGLLTALGTPTIATGTQPRKMAVSADGKHVYVVDATAGVGTIHQYSRNTSTGQLVALSPATVAVASGPMDITITPDGKNVYVTAGQEVNQYSRNTTTGLLTALSPGTVAIAGGSINPLGIVAAPDSSHVWVACEDTTIQYSRNSEGKLVLQGSRTSPHLTRDITVSGDNRNVYGASSPGEIADFWIGPNDMINPVNKAAVTLGEGPEAIVVAPGGKFVYVAKTNKNQVTGLTRQNPTPTIVTNNGEYEVGPIIEIFGPGSAFKLENKTTGAFVLLEGTTLAAGEFFVIDFANRTIRKNGTTNAYGSFVFAASTWWKLAPGANEIVVTGDSSIQWRNTYL